MNLHIKLNGLLNNDASRLYSTRITSMKYFSLFYSMQMIMHEIIQSFVNIHIAKIIQADMLP